MSLASGPFSEEEVQQIVSLIEKLEQSSFDFLQLELGDLKVTVSKGEYMGPPTAVSGSPVGGSSVAGASATVPTINGAAGAGAAKAIAGPRPSTAAPAAAAVAAVAPADADTLVIKAPIMGRFYAQSEPGAPPFVTVGDKVAEDTTVAIIEVMKVFNAVKAEVRGVITAICVQDGGLVQFGQELFRVRPAPPA